MWRLLIQVLWGRRELSSSKISTTSPHTLKIMKRRFCPAEIVSSQTWRGSIFTMTDTFGILALDETGSWKNIFAVPESCINIVRKSNAAGFERANQFTGGSSILANTR
jgi:hypothetical protein